MATDIVIPVRDRKTNKWRVVGLHIESGESSYFGMVFEDEFDDLQEAAMRAIAMQVQLKKVFEVEQPDMVGMPNRKQRRAMKVKQNG